MDRKKKRKTKYDKNMSKILYLQLAFESYYDHSGSDSELYDKINIQTADLWKQENKLDERTKVKMSKDILKQYKDLLKMVGKEKFIFYHHGSVEYKWDDTLLKGENIV